MLHFFSFLLMMSMATTLLFYSLYTNIICILYINRRYDLFSKVRFFMKRNITKVLLYAFLLSLKLKHKVKSFRKDNKFYSVRVDSLMLTE